LNSHGLGIPTTPSAAAALPTSAVSATHTVAIDDIRRWNMYLMRSIRSLRADLMSARLMMSIALGARNDGCAGWERRLHRYPAGGGWRDS
jgi:hypothetical protein